jgi:hypothetical protein
MRKEYGKVLREFFAAHMETTLPLWKPVKPPKSHYFPGERAFVLDRAPVAWLVIILQPNLKDHEAFDIQVGWSTLCRLPEISMRPCIEKPRSAEAQSRAEYVCGLRELAFGNEYANGWVIDERTFSADAAQIISLMMERQEKIADEKARETLAPLVDDAVSALIGVGVPYLESCLASIGRSRE